MEFFDGQVGFETDTSWHALVLLRHHVTSYEYMRYIGQTNCQEFLWDSGQYPASTDFDLVLGRQNDNELFYINTGMVADLGANLYGPSGVTVDGSGGQAYFSHFEVDQLGAAPITYHV